MLEETNDLGLPIETPEKKTTTKQPKVAEAETVIEPVVTKTAREIATEAVLAQRAAAIAERNEALGDKVFKRVRTRK